MAYFTSRVKCCQVPLDESDHPRLRIRSTSNPETKEIIIDQDIYGANRCTNNYNLNANKDCITLTNRVTRVIEFFLFGQ